MLQILIQNRNAADCSLPTTPLWGKVDLLPTSRISWIIWIIGFGEKFVVHEVLKLKGGCFSKYMGTSKGNTAVVNYLLEYYGEHLLARNSIRKIGKYANWAAPFHRGEKRKGEISYTAVLNVIYWNIQKARKMGKYANWRLLFTLKEGGRVNQLYLRNNSF